MDEDVCPYCGCQMVKDSCGGPDGAGYHTFYFYTCENPECEGEAA